MTCNHQPAPKTSSFYPQQAPTSFFFSHQSSTTFSTKDEQTNSAETPGRGPVGGEIILLADRLWPGSGLPKSSALRFFYSAGQGWAGHGWGRKVCVLTAGWGSCFWCLFFGRFQGAEILGGNLGSLGSFGIPTLKMKC